MKKLHRSNELKADKIINIDQLKSVCLVGSYWFNRITIMVKYNGFYGYTNKEGLKILVKR